MPFKPSSEPIPSPPDKSQVGESRAASSSDSRRDVPPSCSGISRELTAAASTSTQHGVGRVDYHCKQGETQGDVPPPYPPPPALPVKSKRKRDYRGATSTQHSVPTKVGKIASGVGERDHHRKVAKSRRGGDRDDPLEGPSSTHQRLPRPAPLQMPTHRVKEADQEGAQNPKTPLATQKRKMGEREKIDSSVQVENSGTAKPSKRKKKNSGPSVENTSDPSTPRVTFASSYTLGEKLGKGGYGCVYAGTRKSDGLQVAIKIIPRASAPRYITMPDSDVRLPLEVALMTIVSQPPECPNIINLLEWFEGPTVFIFVLERPMPCMDLFQYLSRLPSRLSETEVKHIFRQVVCAAKHCNDRGVFHRDIKLENILITEDRTIKLIDFGCGDLLKESPYSIFAGTKAYTPPEWLLEHHYEGQTATVWSLGVLLYVLLCGRMPFVNKDQIVTGRLQFRRGLSCECRNLMHWCLRKDPAKRPGLEQILNHKWLTETD